MKLLRFMVVFCAFIPFRICYRNPHNRLRQNLHICHKTKKVKIVDKEKMPNELYKSFTFNQQTYADYLTQEEDNITIVEGPAGTGKTWLACQMANKQLKQEKIKKIIITRPVVSVEEDIGFLPGTINTKMNPWIRPILDIFEENYSKAQVTQMIQDGKIEISPLGFMRGRTFKDAFIIADEMQNSSPAQMLMLLTRIGANSRMVITGDIAQSDRLENNGLKDLVERCHKTSIYNENIHLVRLNHNDVKRSNIVRQVLTLYANGTAEQKKFTHTKPQCIPINLESNGNDDAALIPKRLIRNTF